MVTLAVILGVEALGLVRLVFDWFGNASIDNR
jgi:hypothetical protein